MATTVTVPGASDTYLANAYNTPANLSVAQAIANALFLAKYDDVLDVQYSDEDPGPVPVGDVGELAVTLPGASAIVLPAGYAFTAIDQSVPGPLTVSGGGSLFVGNQSTTYYGSAASGTVSIAAGDGNDQIGLPSGTSYVVALGNGDDVVFANGSGTVTGGTGNSIFFADSAGGQNEINSYGNDDTIVAGAGTVTVNSFGTNPLIYGGSGNLVYLGGAPGNPTIVGGAGAETLFGAAGQNITYADGTSTTPDANILAAGSGNETLNAGGTRNGVEMAAGNGSVTMIGSSGNDIFFSGSGTAVITGNGGSDALIVGNTAGHTGGTDIFTDFSSSDTFVVVGYGANAAQTALNQATVSGGNTTVKLADNTSITFLNVSIPGSINNQSF